MKRSRALFALLAGVAVVAVAIVGYTTASASIHGVTPIPAFSVQQLTAEPSDDWLTSRGDIWNRQFSSLTTINASNVASLKLAWHTRVAIPGKKQTFTGVSDEAEPVVYNGTMYMPDSKGHVFAFDAATGERLWYYTPKYPKGFASGLPTSRGLAIGNGKVYMAQTDGTIVGLDQSTGRVTWKTTVGNFKAGYFFTQPPTYVNGTLYIGTSGGDFGAASKVVALDASTGKIKWTFNLIPRKAGELGANTWAKTDYDGGGAVWAPLALDPANNLVYVGVGNPIPYNGNARGQGKDLFTESVVALNMSTGKLKWYYQEVHHDIWDYDTAANPLVLFNLKIKGSDRQAVASMGKTGWVYLLDRITGKPILGINEKKVPQSAAQHTYPTQPIPVGQPFAAQCADKKALVEVEGAGRQAGHGRLHLHAVHDHALHRVRPDRTRRRRLAAFELQPEDRLHVRLLEGQLRCLEGTAEGAVDQAAAARQLLPDRRAVPACGQSGPQARRQGRRHGHAHEHARLVGGVPRR